MCKFEYFEKLSLVRTHLFSYNVYITSAEMAESHIYFGQLTQNNRNTEHCVYIKWNPRQLIADQKWVHVIYLDKYCISYGEKNQ